MFIDMPAYSLPTVFPQTSPQLKNMAINIEILTNTAHRNTMPTETTISGVKNASV
jgi:hypothetical protein